MKKILATSFHPGGANSIVPVIKSLNERNQVEVVVIGYKFSEKVFQAAFIDYKTISDYGLNNVSVDSMTKILQMESPDLVITGTSIQNEEYKTLIDQTSILAAKQKGIRTISVLDVWGCYTEKFSNQFTDEKFKFLPDKIAIMDNIAKEAMLKEGFDEERLVVTGNPYFDHIAELKSTFGENEKRKVKSDLDIDLNTSLILYASQPIEAQFGDRFGYTEKTVLKELIDGLSTQKDRNFTLLIKVHPREKISDFQKIKSTCSFPIIIEQNYPVRQLIMASDIVISSFSTVLIESSYLNKISISLQPGLKTKDLLITNSLGITIPVYRCSEIGSILLDILPNYAKNMPGKAYLKTDGKATQRVIRQIYDMLEINDEQQ